MDRLLNETHDGKVSTSVSSLIDKLLIIAPSLDSVNQDLKWVFVLHSYGFAVFFFFLCFYTFFSFLNLRSLISSRPYMSTINVFLCLLGLSRSGCLMIDPYNLKERMPKVIGAIVWDIGFPFLTSTFCLIQLALLELTQLKLGLEKFHRESYLTLVIMSHFTCVIIGDVALVFHNHYLTKYVLQTVFLVWGITLYITFLYTGLQIRTVLRRLPPNVLIRENSYANQKGIMQLAMLAPYNNLATSVAAALVPTLLGPARINFGQAEQQIKKNQDTKPSSIKLSKSRDDDKKKQPLLSTHNDPIHDVSTLSNPMSMVPEVYIRPPTPTPSMANLPIITVSSPSRRSSLSSRRGSDYSHTSRRVSECSIRFAIDEEDLKQVKEEQENSKDTKIKAKDSTKESNTSVNTNNGDFKKTTEANPLTGSTRDIRRSSDLGHEKVRSQFSTKLRRNSDFGNRVPKHYQEEQAKLSRISDNSSGDSRRNSDFCGLIAARAVESRRNSDSFRSSERRGSDFAQLKQIDICSSMKKKSCQKTPTDQSENSVQPAGADRIEAENGDEPVKEHKVRKKNLSWKCDTGKDDFEDITAETSLLPESNNADARAASADFTLHSVLNHIAYVNNRNKNVPLFVPEANTAASRKSQIERVLNVAYATAILGIILCVADVFRILGPYGLFADSIKYGSKPQQSQYPKPWPWLIYQTLCRLLELVMGCAMASITKQPSASPRHQYLNNYSNYNLPMKI